MTNFPEWFQVADLADQNEGERREDPHYSLDSLIMGIPFFGK
jgi:hypothetical protein